MGGKNEAAVRVAAQPARPAPIRAETAKPGGTESQPASNAKNTSDCCPAGTIRTPAQCMSGTAASAAAPERAMHGIVAARSQAGRSSAWLFATVVTSATPTPARLTPATRSIRLASCAQVAIAAGPPSRTSSLSTRARPTSPTRTTRRGRIRLMTCHREDSTPSVFYSSETVIALCSVK